MALVIVPLVRAVRDLVRVGELPGYGSEFGCSGAVSK